MISGEPAKPSALSYLNLSSHYERKARLLPGILSIMVLLPLAAAVGAPLIGWITVVLTGLGLGAVAAVGISHLSSAAGNRIQRKLWPRWPHDSPTNRWLHPEDATRSAQQKKNLYAAIKRLTNLDIAATEPDKPGEMEAVINDAVITLRYRLIGSKHATRMDDHNADYGFVRNFTGLRPFWFSFAVASAVGCWVAYGWFAGALLWAIIATALAVALLPVGLVILPEYVRVRAGHYAESFLSATLELDRATSGSPMDGGEKAGT
jgi:hypothetical protein